MCTDALRTVAEPADQHNVPLVRGVARPEGDSIHILVAVVREKGPLHGGQGWRAGSGHDIGGAKRLGEQEGQGGGTGEAGGSGGADEAHAGDAGRAGRRGGCLCGRVVGLWGWRGWGNAMLLSMGEGVGSIRFHTFDTIG